MTDEIQEGESNERHPVRFLLKVAVFGALVYAVGRFLAQKKDEYSDLTETQAREKIVERMSPRLGDETATEIADQVVPKLKDRGLVKSDTTEGDGTDEVSETVED